MLILCSSCTAPLSAPSPPPGPKPLIQDTSPHDLDSHRSSAESTSPSRLPPPKGTRNKMGIFCSTKTSVSPTTNMAPDPVQPQIRSHKVFLKIVEITGIISTDQTSRFSVTSRCSNKYLMVLFEYDRNAILVKPLQVRQHARTCSCLQGPPSPPM